MTTTRSESGVLAGEAPASVIPLNPRFAPTSRSAIDPLTAIAALVAVVLALSPLSSGYYDFTTWAPLTLGAVALVVVLACLARPQLTRTAVIASAGLLLLLAISFASLLWAESRDSAWEGANQLVLYAAIFAIGMLAIRQRRSAQTVILILGLPALLTSVVLAVILVAGGGGDAYLLGRLDQPIGYVNATAGLLIMGIWPWLALAEVASRRIVRVAAIGGSSLIAAVAVTTQARALLPAFVLTTVLVMIAAPGRTRRGLSLLIVALTIVAGAHWTLAIYSSTGPAQQYMPRTGVLRGAGIAMIATALLAVALAVGLDRLRQRIPAAERGRVSRRFGQAMLLAVAAAVIALGVGARGTIATQWKDFTHLNAEQSAPDRFVAIGSGFRYDLWRIALDEFKADPLGGVGAGNYDDSYYRLRRNPQSVTVPHSLEMQMLAELGIGGVLGLLLFCGGVLRAGLRADRRTLAGSDIGIRVAALGIFAAWLVETSFDWLYDIPGLTGMAILAATILLVRGPDNDPAISGARSISVRPGISGRLLLVAALTVLAVLAASVGRQYVATLYGDSGKRLVSKHPVQALQTLRTAEQLDPWSLQTQYEVAAAYARLDDYDSARAALLKAERLEPENYVPPALLGDLATRAGDTRAALNYYRRALRLDPLEPSLQEAVRSSERRA